jgi:hypothetical protein
MAATKDRIFADAIRMLADARFTSITDDTESLHALSDAWDEAVIFCLRQANWRFAMLTAGPSDLGPAQNYTHSFSLPSDLIRIQSVFYLAIGSREYPIDFREYSGKIYTDAASIAIRYVSSSYAVPTIADWPENFAQVVAAYLAFLVAERVTGERGAAGRMSSLFSQHLEQAAAIDAEPDDRWLRFERNGEMLFGARDLLGRGAWRFALVDGTSGTPSAARVAGFLYSFQQPTNWIGTHKLFLTSVDGREFPLDIREQGGYWSTNIVAFNFRYVSSDLGLDSTQWDDSFRTALLAYLEAGRPAQRPPADEAQKEAAPAWERLLMAALAECAEPLDPWYRHQISGTFQRARLFVLQQGYWVYRDPAGIMRGLKERQYTALDDQLATAPDFGLPYRYPLPADWFKTHALFVPWDGQERPINIRESASDWSTDAESFVARYVSTDVLDATGWPEAIAQTVLAYCDWQMAPPQEAKERATKYLELLTAAKSAHSRQEDDWLRFELDGSFEAARKEELEKGRWRFAIKTVLLTPSTDPLPSEESDGTMSSSYAYRFIQPNDLLRTVRVYYDQGVPPYGRRLDIDFRDEQGGFHANYASITVRYVSRMGLDSTRWPAAFRDALLAWLQYREARGDPQKTAIANAKYAVYEAACREAERLDDARDRPAIIRSRIVAARFGRSPRDRELGVYPYWP